MTEAFDHSGDQIGHDAANELPPFPIQAMPYSAISRPGGFDFLFNSNFSADLSHLFSIEPIFGRSN